MFFFFISNPGLFIGEFVKCEPILGNPIFVSKLLFHYVPSSWVTSNKISTHYENLLQISFVCMPMHGQRCRAQVKIMEINLLLSKTWFKHELFSVMFLLLTNCLSNENCNIFLSSFGYLSFKFGYAHIWHHTFKEKGRGSKILQRGRGA